MNMNMSKTDEMFTIALVGLIVCFSVAAIIIYAEATGGAGDIKNLIDPILDRAIEALENNNSDLAAEELQSLKNELDDTFAAEESEESESEEN